MNAKPSVLILGGVVSLAAIAGGTYAAMQSQTPPPSTTGTLTTPSIATTSATPTSPPQGSTAASPIESPPPSPQPSTRDRPAPTQQPAIRDVKSCKVSMALVQDPHPPLNVRSTPTAEGSKIIGQLQNGTMVTVAQEQAGWFEITMPLQGWIAKDRTESGCNQKIERVQLGTGETKIKLSDRFIGTGSHQYLMNAAKGQVMTLTSQNGPLPILLGPNGKTLNAGMDDRQTHWSGELPQTGDYTIEYDSNFRGYKYSLEVEIQ